jgi:epoxide hydrolase 4
MLNHGIQEHSATIRSLKTGWLEAGVRGNPVLFFCHGFPDDPNVWTAQIETLMQDFHILAPYVRGCDRSDAAEDLKRYSRDAIVLDHLEILHARSDAHTPVICIGHDLGVVHALTLARRLGPRAQGVVVINGLDIEMFTKRLQDPNQVMKSWYMGFMQLPVLPELLATYAPSTSSWLTQTIAGSKSEIDARGFDRRTTGPLNQYRAFAREASKPPSAMEPRLKCPVLVIWGRDDGVLRPPTQQEWDLIGLNVTIRIIPGGHWLQRDEADAVSQFIEKFSKSLTISTDGNHV